MADEMFRFQAKDKATLEYTDGHIQRVNKAYAKYGKKILEALNIPGSEKELYTRCINHDKSKYSEDEFIGYRMNFSPKKDEDEEAAEKEWVKAWNHHQKSNDHHPEFWVLLDDESHDTEKTSTKAGVVHYTPIEMPKIALAEMLCDWASFTNSTPRIWFKKCMQYYAQIMHPATFKLVDRVTKTIWGE